MEESRLIEIYHDTIRPLYASVSGWTRGDREQAEDIVQETYLRAVREWRQAGLPDRPLAWLRTVARNLVVSEARRHRPESDSERTESAWAPDPELPREERLAIANGLGALPRVQARLLRAFHLEGHTMRDIAANEGISERAVEGRLRRARAALQRHLTRDRGPSEEKHHEP